MSDLSQLAAAAYAQQQDSPPKPRDVSDPVAAQRAKVDEQREEERQRAQAISVAEREAELERQRYEMADYRATQKAAQVEAQASMMRSRRYRQSAVYFLGGLIATWGALEAGAWLFRTPPKPTEVAK